MATPLDLARLEHAIQHEGGLSRRLFLAYAASISSLPLLSQRAGAAPGTPPFDSDPFQLGVASGDPDENSVVLWTRLAPAPLERAGGMKPQNVEVRWEIAADESMRRVLKRGTQVATPELAHSIHAEVNGLKPDRWYWYRFHAGDAVSPVGRTRTLPLAASMPSRLQFAFASCQHYETGLYTAYQHMAEEDLDLVFHLGDYIYERGGEAGRVRRHAGNKCYSLHDYRTRIAQYRSDPFLHGMHARCPWVVTWDDHEVENNYANDRSEIEDMDPAKFLVQRANAYQAYYEMMPLRNSSLPRGPHMNLYRSFTFGQLANFLVLDGRQYRSDQADHDHPGEISKACLNPRQTMLGSIQLKWVENTLSHSTGRWNVLAQQVMMATVAAKHKDIRRYGRDNWCGYLGERNKLMSFIHDHQVPNAVVLTGDIHCNIVNDLRIDDLRIESPIAAAEFVGTSISSDGDGGQAQDRMKQLMADYPGVRYFNAERGYVRCTVTPERWQSDYRTIPYVSKPGAPIKTRTSFVLEPGQSGVKTA